MGLFRNGHFVQYRKDLNNQKLILEWMTDEETLKIIGIIDEARKKAHNYHKNITLIHV